MAKLLFCEDEFRIQKLIRTVLRSTSHQILIASDGIEGLRMIEEEHPDLIFTDISMPLCDGFQLAKRVKENPRLAMIPIIFVTAFAQRAEIEEGYRYGAIGYLLKPFSPSDFREKIEEYVSTLIAKHENV